MFVRLHNSIVWSFDIKLVYREWYLFFFFFKQKTAYEMRISDWSSDVCSSDLADADAFVGQYDVFFDMREAGRKPLDERGEVGLERQYATLGMVQGKDQLIVEEPGVGGVKHCPKARARKSVV